MRCCASASAVEVRSVPQEGQVGWKLEVEEMEVDVKGAGGARIVVVALVVMGGDVARRVYGDGVWIRDAARTQILRC